MNGDGRCSRHVADVMSVIAAECVRVAGANYLRKLTWTTLLKNPCCHNKGPQRRTMIVEACGLPWQPS
jgi:hypothetical protein